MTVPSTPRPRRGHGSCFWTSVEKTEECWLWTGALNRNGYGNYWHPVEKRNIGAHRYAYLEQHSIPELHELHHTCHVRNCVRPSHLVPVTRPHHRELDAQIITRCPKGHEYTVENTRILTYGNGQRGCKRCHADREARARKEGRRG